ncbi:hypothetical protein Dthio_PD1437 [Desulfonatronospira thiodismutans ASO3-1]|uniref:Uncharacterized protein n=1 Tax=Desulfonatronospira thiodismutans ASO3-1 TaxID=555779 RepID=D6STT1_9BACT|nr:MULTISPECIES: hypothetical protein [Desulfonatronospira]EFI34097.1 hypothetical protein Dthio_PD1437 [Desulfonatronospira thiodismutans ASO3-1]RQD78782.1 MAG: hypothetical protein D5S03_01445 [Desulfonatronospira sp. MSAO_Bac3]
MALLITTQPYAQQEIIRGITRVICEHSPNSRRKFQEKLHNLAALPSTDVVITGYTEGFSHPEFTLAWYRQNGNPDLHPLERQEGPFMVGVMVFHDFEDCWCTHT